MRVDCLLGGCGVGTLVFGGGIARCASGDTAADTLDFLNIVNAVRFLLEKVLIEMSS